MGAWVCGCMGVRYVVERLSIVVDILLPKLCMFADLRFGPFLCSTFLTTFLFTTKCECDKKTKTARYVDDHRPYLCSCGAFVRRVQRRGHIR